MTKLDPTAEAPLRGIDLALSGSRLPLLLAAYFCVHLLIRLSVSGTLALDEAEQVLLSQWFQWGYSGQPPLYAWVQHLVFDMVGTNLVALALLKNGLLFLSYLLFWLTALRIWPRREDLASLVVLSWLLIPQIVWEAQRDLSHSVMALALASASLYVVARALTHEIEKAGPLRPCPGLPWYLAYGVVMGLGFLSKYNFFVFAGGLNLALLSLPRGRQVLLDLRILLTLAAAAVVAIPHFMWAFDHAEVAVRSLSKVDASGGNNRLMGLGVLLVAAVSFLSPLWVMYLAVFPKLFGKLFRRGLARDGAPGESLTGRYLLVLFLGLAAAILVLGVGHVKERWMIPFLFLVPLFFFAGVGKDTPGGSGARWFRRVTAMAALATLLAAGLRVALGPTLGVTTRVNYPFDAVAEAVQEAGLEAPTLLTHNSWFAGNLLKRFPGSRAYVPGYVLPDPEPGQSVLVVWDAVRSEPLPEELRAELRVRFGLSPAGSEVEYAVFPYKFGAGREARVGFLRLGGG